MSRILSLSPNISCITTTAGKGPSPSGRASTPASCIFPEGNVTFCNACTIVQFPLYQNSKREEVPYPLHKEYYIHQIGYHFVQDSTPHIPLSLIAPQNSI